MRKFFENPEMIINSFDVENVVTTSELTPAAAQSAIADGKVILKGVENGQATAATTQIFSFKN